VSPPLYPHGWRNDAYSFLSRPNIERGGRPGTRSMENITDALSTTPVDASFYFDADAIPLCYALPDTDDNGASTPVEITPRLATFHDYVSTIPMTAMTTRLILRLSDDVFHMGEPVLLLFSYPVDGSMRCIIAMTSTIIRCQFRIYHVYPLRSIETNTYVILTLRLRSG